MRAKKKPIIIEAVQIELKSESNDPDANVMLFSKERPTWMGQAIEDNRELVGSLYLHESGKYFCVHTLEGVMKGRSMDYLMKGVNGELYICKKEVFEQTYSVEPEGWLDQLIWSYFS